METAELQKEERMPVLHKPIAWFSDLKLRTKLIICFTLIIIIPITLIGGLYFRNSSRVISELAGKNVYEIVKKNNQIIDTKLSKVGENTISMVHDSDLYKAFSNTKDIQNMNIIDMDRQVTTVLAKYFSSSADILSSVLATSYFSFGSGNSANLSATYISNDSYLASKLYSDAIQAKGSLIWEPTYDFTVMFNHPGLSLKPSSRFVFSAVRVVDSYYLDNFILNVLDKSIERPTLIVNFSENVLSDVYDNSVPIKGTKYMIVTRGGQVVSSTDKNELSTVMDFPWLEEAVTKQSGTVTFNEEGRKYIVCYDSSKVTGWISAAVIPADALMSDILPAIRTYTILIALIFIIVSVPLGYLLSGLIFSPIRKLLSAMKKMGEGNFDVRIPVERKDELGYFVEKFNRLNEKIKLLIEENYEVKLREKETEIMALNLQMNPHFLYNTLNLINWMAIEAQQEKMSNIIMELCNMLVYTLKHKGDIADFHDDLEWLKCYLYIISCRFEDKFTVEIDIDPVLDAVPVPKLFLQPFVENAIIHGFEYMEEGCRIRITGRVEEQQAVFCIEDNGMGMSKERINEIMNMESSAIGVKNVDKRIKLLYGDDFGVSIKSHEGTGTCVTIRIPFTPSK